MSENLDLMRSIHAEWEHGDFSSADWADPEIEFEIVGGHSPGSWNGVAGMARGFRDWLSAWEGFRFEADESRELDDERVLVLAHAGGGRRKTSGMELTDITTKAAALFHVHGGKVTRLVIYADRDRALADLGLEE